MDFRLDQSLVALGIDTVVVGIARNVDPQAVLLPSFLEKKKELEQWALQCQTEEVVASPVIKGYTDLLQKVGRSIKKNPPTVLALIRNIQHRGALPQINSIIDIYNVESLKSFLAIGGHDLDKIEGPIEFTLSQRTISFSLSFLVKNMSHRQILSTGIKKEFWLGWMYAIVTITNLRRLRKTPSLSSKEIPRRQSRCV